MFTVEMEDTHTVVITMDETDSYEDVEVSIHSDDTVFITQHHPDLDSTEVIYMSYQQLNDIVTAMNMPVGMYLVSKGE